MRRILLFFLAAGALLVASPTLYQTKLTKSGPTKAGQFMTGKEIVNIYYVDDLEGFDVNALRDTLYKGTCEDKNLREALQLLNVSATFIYVSPKKAIEVHIDGCE